MQRIPVVNLRVLKDRNFAVGSLMIFVMAAVLYSSAVVIPQLAQTQLGYTATLAGYILSPGALMVCFAIPIVGRMLPVVQTRFLIAFGFVLLGASLLYSHTLTPDIDFITLSLMRMAQTVGLAFLFVPISTITYATLPKEQNGDAAALFTMFRNVAGSIGISAATAMVTQRTQIRMAHLVRASDAVRPALRRSRCAQQTATHRARPCRQRGGRHRRGHGVHDLAQSGFDPRLLRRVHDLRHRRVPRRAVHASVLRLEGRRRWRPGALNGAEPHRTSEAEPENVTILMNALRRLGR